MKVYLGPYKNWWGPFQIAELLRFVGVDEPTRDKVGAVLATSWVADVCYFVDKLKNERKQKIRIDEYDTWNMDTTLSLIIVPMLKKLKETKHGAPFVDDDDVPDELKSTSAPAKANEWDTDDNHFKRWDWVLDQMIWSFEQKIDPNEGQDQYYDAFAPDELVKPFTVNVLQEDGTVVEREFMNEARTRELGQFNKEKYAMYSKRKSNGFRLFGKYFEALWD